MTTGAGIIRLMGIQADVDPATRIHCPYQPFRRRRRLSHNVVFQQSQVSMARDHKSRPSSVPPRCNAQKDDRSL
jgi:hypothetical protein